MAAKKYSDIPKIFLQLCLISVLSFFMNRYRFPARHFIFPATLFILPLAFDGTFRPKDIFKPSKEGCTLFLTVTAAVLVFLRQSAVHFHRAFVRQPEPHL